MSFTACRLLALPAAMLAGLVHPKAGAAELLAGPLVGHTTSTSTRIWVETSEPASVRINYWLKPRLWYDGPTLRQPVHLGSGGARTTAEPPYIAVIELRELPPGWMMNYTVLLDERPVRALSTQSVSLMPPDSQAAAGTAVPAFSVAFGSCNHPPRAPLQPIWTQVLRRRPAAFIFLGDNNYLPKDPEMYEVAPADLRVIVADTHRSLRNIAGLRELMASTPCYAIWDDHDFGPNNSDRTFRHRATTLELFQQYWPNPDSGAREVPGVFHSFRVADVEFFLLDNRYHRDPNPGPGGSGTMFGAAQLDWLKRRLEASPAVFKVIGQGGTSLVESAGEAWTAYGSERDEFLAWLFSRNITGVFFLAGDWHVGVLNRLHRPGDAYPLYELLSSNLAVNIQRSTTPRADRRTGPGTNQWASPYVQDYNFGLLNFAGPAGARTATLQLVDELGTVRTELRLAEADLKPARPSR